MENKQNTENLEQAHLDFISTVSHELRTPLTSIRGFADTMLSSYDRLTDEQRLKFLQIIKDQSNRLIGLVENLLAVSKMQSDRELMVYKAADVRPLIDYAVQIIKNQYKTHRYIINYDKNLPEILIDTDKFQQIMINLIDNASKYSPENSAVTIQAGQDFIKNTLYISVTDEGSGIKEEDIPKIFNKFSRIDSPLTRKVSGSGLGLYITKTLIEKMGGSIDVKSGEKGSIFTVTFRAASFEDTAKRKMKE